MTHSRKDARGGHAKRDLSSRRRIEDLVIKTRGIVNWGPSGRRFLKREARRAQRMADKIVISLELLLYYEQREEERAQEEAMMAADLDLLNEEDYPLSDAAMDDLLRDEPDCWWPKDDLWSGDASMSDYEDFLSDSLFHSCGAY